MKSDTPKSFLYISISHVEKSEWKRYQGKGIADSSRPPQAAILLAAKGGSDNYSHA